MADQVQNQAWVALPSDQEAYHSRNRGGPYDFGFALGMSKLQQAHPRLGAAFGRMYSEIMFSDEGVLSRQERELVAAVSAAAQDCYY